eukprot:2067210-Alexandrium_andersonii.AAC.1
MEIPNWLPDAPYRKAVNIVDHGSALQKVHTIEGIENAANVREAYSKTWLDWAGPPREMVIDAAKQNAGAAAADPLEREGTTLRPIAGEGQWQNGMTERHGGIWKRMFERVLAEFQPSSETEYQECIRATTLAKSMTFRHYGYSPYQHVFGKDPYIASDLLQTPLDAIAGTLGASDPAAARADQVRALARKAALEAQDDRAVRQA